MAVLVWEWTCAGCGEKAHTETAVPPGEWAAIDGADWHIVCFADPAKRAAGLLAIAKRSAESAEASAAAHDATLDIITSGPDVSNG